MNIVDISLKRPVLTTMVLLAFAVFGLLSYFAIPVQLFPNMQIPTVTIQTVYPGASPDVIEAQVTKKIEDRVASLADLESIQSYSLDSASLVVVSFKYGKDENLGLQEVKDKVGAIVSELPADAKAPAITKVDISSFMPVMSIVLDGSLSPTELYTFASTTVSDRLSQVSGVGSVDIAGGQEREIRVELDRSTVYQRDVPLTQIAGILAAANVELPGGNLTQGDQDVPVRLKGEFGSLDEIRDLDVPTSTGIYKLRQLADVRDASKTARERTVFVDKKAGSRNDDALLVQIVKNPSANTIQVVDDVMKRIPEIESASNGRVKLKIVNEDATFVRDSVSDTLSNVYLGIIFTGLVLLLFLHDVRSTIIVALAMPFSIISTFLIMRVMGISLNILSLMGLSSATGTLVANSVVVIENIFRYKELGHGRAESASKGTREVLIAVFASTLTNVAVFLPLANMDGVMGAVLSNFAYTIVIATVFSIFVSFTLTPLLASLILPEKVKKEGKLSLGIEATFKSWERGYGRMLAVILKSKRRSLAVVGAVLAAFVVSVMLFSLIKMELMPNTDGGKVQVVVELPQGSDLAKTAAVLSSVEATIGAYPEVTRMLTTLGSVDSLNTDVSVARMDVFLVPKGARKESNTAVSSRMLSDLSLIPGAAIRVTPLSEMGGGSGDAPIDLYLRGQDIAVVQRLAEELRARFNQVPGVMNLNLSSKSGKTELSFAPNRKRLSVDGLSVQEVAVALRSAVDGLVTTTYKEGGAEYDVRVVVKDSSIADLEDLKNIPVVSSRGTHPLSWYADIRFTAGYNKIMRVDKYRTVEITSDLLPGYTQGDVLAALMAAAEDVRLPEGYSLKPAGNSEQMTKAVGDLLTVFFIAVLLTYMLLAATLESFTQPLFILATVPLAIIGVVAFCLPLGTVLNIVALLGIIMLVGIVVNNAILMLDYYNQLRRAGATSRDAMLEAAPTKLKPILMANIAVILGMLPMALGIGASGAEMRQPMGVVIIGGIVSSTLLTLFLIPALEILTAKRRNDTAATEAAR